MKRILAVVMLLGLSACTGAPDPTVPDPTGVATYAPESALPPLPATKAGPAPRGALPVVPGELCAFLDAEAPELESVGSEAAALARFGSDFADWVAQSPSTRQPNGELDSLTTAMCPDVRARVVAALGSDSFASALGGG